MLSNRGGRQLDGVLSSTRALPPFAHAVGDKLTVLADSGVHSGLDVVRMLATGAKGPNEVDNRSDTWLLGCLIL